MVILAVKAWCVCGAVACGQMLPFGDLWSICVAMQVGVCGGWPCLRRMAGDFGRQALACSADCVEVYGGVYGAMEGTVCCGSGLLNGSVV